MLIIFKVLIIIFIVTYGTWNGLKLCFELGKLKLGLEVYPFRRFFKQKKNGVINIDKIIITNKFKQTRPKYWKVIKKTRYIDKNGCPEHPITLNKSGVLLDGYIDYLVCKALDIKWVSVKYE